MLGGTAVTVVLFLVLRPGDGDEEAAPPATTASTPTPVETATTTEPAPPPPPPKPKVRVVRITISGGEVKGGLRTITIERGRTFELVVTSDVHDHVHVHGIDAFRDVGPGQPARFTLKPTVAGRYEIELEERHFLIAQLNVEP